MMVLLLVEGHGLDPAGRCLGLSDLEPFRMRLHVLVEALYQNLDSVRNFRFSSWSLIRLYCEELDRNIGLEGR
ncbi:MAG: hypothetical protein F9K13_06935 [Candidatus Methylomirabilis oxygeniifera]|nr:MAG: hypothetical protein F9K13_06935 [Candidatus Methylomirabilis oxyfera]